MQVIIDIFDLKQLFIDAAEIAVACHEKGSKPKTDELTQRDAYKKFGEAWVKNCVKRGLVKKFRKGTSKNSPLYYSRTELLAARKSENMLKTGIINPVA